MKLSRRTILVLACVASLALVVVVGSQGRALRMEKRNQTLTYAAGNGSASSESTDIGWRMLYGDHNTYGDSLVLEGVATPAPTRTPVAVSTHAALMNARAMPQYRELQEALPSSGILASTFVPGGGVAARLEDLLDRGVMIGGEQVKLAAFEDRERAPYPIPEKEAVALYAELERARVHDGGERVHLQIALVGRKGEGSARPRMDVRLVLDRSGSMEGEKWQQAIAAAHALVDKLSAGDTFGLVTYATDATVDFGPAKVGDRKAAHAAISGLIAVGSTNIGAALDAVKANPPVRRSPSDVALVVVVSDGRVTVGETMPSTLGSKARAMFDASGVITTSIGLGTDFDEATMLEIAREGGGSYHFVRRAADIAGILNEELDMRAQAVAQALKVKIVLAPGVVARRVYGSRLLTSQEHAAVRGTEVATDARIARELGVATDRKKEDKEGLRIHLSTFGRGDQHVVLMELEVPKGKQAAVATVSLEYKDLLGKKNAAASVAVAAERTSSLEESASSLRRPVKRTVLAFQAGNAMQEAANALLSGNRPNARAKLIEQQLLLETAAKLWRDPALARDAELLGKYDRVLQEAWGHWSDSDRQTLMMGMSYYGDQRMR